MNQQENQLQQRLVSLRTRLLVMCASVGIALEEAARLWPPMIRAARPRLLKATRLLTIWKTKSTLCPCVCWRVPSPWQAICVLWSAPCAWWWTWNVSATSREHGRTGYSDAGYARLRGHTSCARNVRQGPDRPLSRP